MCDIKNDNFDETFIIGELCITKLDIEMEIGIEVNEAGAQYVTPEQAKEIIKFLQHQIDKAK